MRLTSGLERLVREIDPSLHVRRTITYTTLVDRSVVTERIMATLGGFFGVLALLIAAIGLFGILAFQVSRRTNELGVRMALGATRPTMIRLILLDVAGMAVAGVLIGAAAALTLSGLARSITVRPDAERPATIAASILGLTALLAGGFRLAALTRRSADSAAPRVATIQIADPPRAPARSRHPATTGTTQGDETSPSGIRNRP
ncbi:MAG: hypothetical protein M3P18_05235 [Actinomycetota bacterium]|nr:hypothetical protein [Actinomycetota bacterium]